MRVAPFEPWHLRSFPDPYVEGMEGLTIFEGDRIVACMGTAPMPWGLELWIARAPPLSFAEKRAIGRVARLYMGELLGQHETLYVHARDREQERWFSWLGLEYAGNLPDGTLRWVAGGVAWASS